VESNGKFPWIWVGGAALLAAVVFGANRTADAATDELDEGDGKPPKPEGEPPAEEDDWIVIEEEDVPDLPPATPPPPADPPATIPSDVTAYARELASAEADGRRTELVEVNHKIQGGFALAYRVYAYDMRIGSAAAKALAIAGDWLPSLIVAKGEFASNQYENAVAAYEEARKSMLAKAG
jgi:hypothetical protein